MRDNEQAHHLEPLTGDTASQEGEAHTAAAGAETSVVVEIGSAELGSVDISASSAVYMGENPDAVQTSSHAVQPSQQPVPLERLLLLALRNLVVADIITDLEI